LERLVEVPGAGRRGKTPGGLALVFLDDGGNDGLLGRNRLPGLMPASAQISAVRVAWNPLRMKQATAASRICCRRAWWRSGFTVRMGCLARLLIDRLVD
jgi:hypothetical protein